MTSCRGTSGRLAGERHPRLAELRLGEAGDRDRARARSSAGWAGVGMHGAGRRAARCRSPGWSARRAPAGDWAVAGAMLARHGEDLRLAGPDAGRISRPGRFPVAGAAMIALPPGCPPPDHPEDKNLWSMFHHGTIGQKWPVAGRICHLLRVRHLAGGAADASQARWEGRWSAGIPASGCRSGGARGLAVEVRPFARVNLMIAFSPGSISYSCRGWPGKNCSSSGSRTNSGVMIWPATSRTWYLWTSVNRSNGSVTP